MKTRIPHEPSAEAILAAVADLKAAEARVEEVYAEIRARVRQKEKDRAVQRVVVWVCLGGLLAIFWGSLLAKALES